MLNTIDYGALAQRHGDLDATWEPEWIIEGIWRRNAVNMYAGTPKKSRKSSMRKYLMACALTGEPAFETFKVRKIERILNILGEDDARIERRHIDTAIQHLGYDPKHYEDSIYHLEIHGQDLKSTIQTQQLLKYVVAEGYDLVNFDPLAHFHSSEENSATEMSIVLRNLHWIADKTAVNVLHHLAKPPQVINKAKGDMANRTLSELLRGSSALAGGHDNLVVALPVGESYTRVRLGFENKVPPPCGQPEEMEVVIDHDTWLWKPAVLLSDQAIIDTLRDLGPLSGSKLAKELGRNKDEVLSRLRVLHEEGRVVEEGKGRTHKYNAVLIEPEWGES